MLILKKEISPEEHSYNALQAEWQDVNNRVDCAKAGYCLNVLLYDVEKDVRIAVAEQKYKLDILMKDKNATVSMVAIISSWNR